MEETKRERILLSGKSEAKYRVAEQLVRNRTEMGRPVLLIDFERSGRLLRGAEQATLASFVGYLNKKELIDLYETMAAIRDLRVNRAAMRRFLDLIWEYYNWHQERLTIDELRTLDVQELKEQVRLSGDVAFGNFLQSHEVGLGEVEDAIVSVSQTFAGDGLDPIRPDLRLCVQAPVDEESPDGRAFLRLLPGLIGGVLEDLQGLGERALLVIQGTPYEASALVDKLTRLSMADLLVVTNDIFGVAESYHASLLSRMDKCLVYSHVLETSAEKWARKIGTHRVHRASVSQAPPNRSIFGRPNRALLTPRTGGMVSAMDMSQSGVVIGTEERLQMMPHEIVQLGPEGCICFDQQTGEFRRM